MRAVDITDAILPLGRLRYPIARDGELIETIRAVMESYDNYHELEYTYRAEDDPLRIDEWGFTLWWGDRDIAKAKPCNGKIVWEMINPNHPDLEMVGRVSSARSFKRAFATSLAYVVAFLEAEGQWL